MLLAPLYTCCEYSYNCIPALESVRDPRNGATLLLLLASLAFVRFCFAAHASAWEEMQGHAAGRENPDTVTRYRPDVADAKEEAGTDANSSEIATCSGSKTTAAGSQACCIDAAYWFLGGAWILLPLLPACHVFLTVGTLVAERLLYMPSVGVVLLVARAIVRFAARGGCAQAPHTHTLPHARVRTVRSPHIL